MQLVCPECGTQIPAENINIQKMAAVCPACNTVFPFDTPETLKAKRRKVKQPDTLVLRDTDDKLDMMFRTNFRLDRSEAFIGSSIGAIVSTLFAGMLFFQSFSGDDVPVFVPTVLTVFAVAFFYWLALTAYNHTHIEVDENTITVSRKPLPGMTQPIRTHLSGVVAFHTEETPKSIKEAYDTPRYRVSAEYADGSQRIIVNDVVEDYGYFIAQRLEERLHLNSEVDVSRLQGTEEIADDDDIDDAMQASTHHKRSR